MTSTSNDPPGKERRSRYQGCLLAGAVGDALGAPIEMMSLSKIRKEFGESGITDLAPAYGRIGSITDDTQMTLFTAEGLLRAAARFIDRGICNPLMVIRRSYLRWLITQGQEPPKAMNMPLDPKSSWLFNIEELHAIRLPGTTCLNALMEPEENLDHQSFGAKNSSKGCGGVMRAAPVGLMFANSDLVTDGQIENSVERDFTFAGKVSLLTHGHPLSTQSSGAMAALVHLLVMGKSFLEALSIVKDLLVRDENGVVVWSLLERGIDLAASDRSPTESIKRLGEGWVAEEALAIAVYACCRGASLKDALLIAVNHDGDSDSTGSIAGNLMGAWCGVEAIPPQWLEKLELREVIREVANDLFDYRHWTDEKWSRYPPY